MLGSDVWHLRGKGGEDLIVNGVVVDKSCIDRLVRGMVAIDNESCWTWVGTASRGRGRIIHRGIGMSTHRLSWTLANQSNIPEGYAIMHNCGNYRCVNPNHLRSGVAKAEGRVNGKAKLTEDAVRSIRARYEAGGVTQSELGREFGVTQETICGVIGGRVWGHLA